MMRRKGFLNPFVSVSKNANSIYLASDGGRLCRPYIIVENGVPLLKQSQIEVFLKFIFDFFGFYKGWSFVFLSTF